MSRKEIREIISDAVMCAPFDPDQFREFGAALVAATGHLCVAALCIIRLAYRVMRFAIAPISIAVISSYYRRERAVRILANRRARMERR
ncbi:MULTISPECIES: hypothetical protein [Cupriavidus]